MQYGKTLKLKKRKIAFENVYRTYIFLLLVYGGADHMKAHSPSELWLRAPCLACSYLGKGWKQAAWPGSWSSARPEPPSLRPFSHFTLHIAVTLGEKDREATWEQCGEFWRQQSASELKSEGPGRSRVTRSELSGSKIGGPTMSEEERPWKVGNQAKQTKNGWQWLWG